MENSSYQKILNLASTIKNIAIEKISTHEEKTSSTQQKGHSYAGGTPQPIGKNIQAGTDNGYYARADHVHTVDFQNIQNTPNALNVVDNLNTDDGSSPLSAKQGKWLNDNKASYQALNDKNVTVTKLATATTGYIATYEVKQGETSIGKIDIPKDYLVKSGTVETVTVADDPVNGYEIGDKYIDFVINTKDNSGTNEHIYINVKDLIDTYTADNNTLQLSNNNQFSIKSGGVTSSHIANGTITGDNIASNAAIDFSKLNISKSNIVGLGIPAQDTIYTPASETPLTEKYMGAVGTGTKYAREDHRHPTFDYLDSGTLGETGYVETIQIKVNGMYQDTPIKIEIFQRQSTQNSILFVRFENIGSTDPAIGSFYHSGSNNSGFWLYKKSTGTYSLIVKKAGTEAHDGIRLKITNPNANIAISNINSQLANLPSNTTTKPLLQSTYIGPESTATNIKMNGTQSAGSLTTYARADHVHPVDTSRATSGHGHGNITNGGVISGAASKNVVTDANGKITTENKPTSLPPTFTHIPASSDNTQDLNSSTYKVGGFYYCSSDKNEAPHISNCPLSGSNNRAFFLLVETWGTTSSYVKQTLTYYNTNKTYTRTCSNDTWLSWVELSKDTNTTYSAATQSANGLMSSTDKTKLDGITASADAVSFTQTKTSGIEIGTITINGTATKLYQQDNNTTYSAGTGLTLSGTSFSLTDASNYVKKSIVTNGTDLNTLRTTGFYYQNDAGQTTNNINMPNNKKDAFTLLVESFGANTFTKQTLTFWDRDFLGTVSSETYIRTSHYNSGNWTKWQMIKNNDNIHFLSHNVGDAGYFKFLSLNTVGTYHDQTISFDITHRGSSKTKVEFNFETYQKSGDKTNHWTRISKFYYDGNPVPVYYVQTKDANRDATFDFYVKRNTWDAMGVSDISTSEDNRSGLTVTRYNTFSTSLPSGAVQATLNPYYSPVNHTHNYLPTNANGTTTGTLTATKFINSSSNNTNILLGNGNTLAQSTFAINGHHHDGTYINDNTGAVTSDNIGEGTIVNYNVAPYAGIEYSKLSGVAPTKHNHSTWTEKQTYSNGDKKIHLYVNEQLRLCDLYWSNVSALNANTNLPVANDGWLTSTYRPSHPVVGGGSYTGTTTVGTGGGINYRIPVTISSNTIYGHAMWHY